MGDLLLRGLSDASGAFRLQLCLRGADGGAGDREGRGTPVCLLWPGARLCLLLRRGAEGLYPRAGLPALRALLLPHSPGRIQGRLAPAGHSGPAGGGYPEGGRVSGGLLFAGAGPAERGKTQDFNGGDSGPAGGPFSPERSALSADRCGKAYGAGKLQLLLPHYRLLLRQIRRGADGGGEADHCRGAGLRHRGVRVLHKRCGYHQADLPCGKRDPGPGLFGPSRQILPAPSPDLPGGPGLFPELLLYPLERQGRAHQCGHASLPGGGPQSGQQLFPLAPGGYPESP